MRPEARTELDGLPVSIAWMDRQHRVLWSNERLARVLGMARSEMSGRTCAELGLGGPQAAAWEASLDEAFETGQGGTLEHLVQLAGRPRLVEYRFVPDRDRERVCVVGFVNARAERLGERLEDRARLLHTFLDSAPLFAWLRDGDGRYRMVNRAYLEHYGLDREEVLGHNLDSRWPEDTARDFAEHDAEVEVEGVAREFVERAPDPDGTAHTFFNVKFPFVDAAGRRFVGGVGIDITRRLECERKLAALERQSLAASLTAGCAHDLSNDLTAAIGFAELADDDPRALDQLVEVLGRARRRLDDLRQAGGRRPSPDDRCDLHQVVVQTVGHLHGVLHDDTRFDVATPEEEVIAVGISRQIRQIFENFFINADEAARPEPAAIAVRFGSRTHPEGLEPGIYWSVRVRDHGPGIPPQLLDEVFAPFRSSKGEGRGVGLAGAQAVARAHGGRITARSWPGEGAELELLLPAADRG